MNLENLMNFPGDLSSSLKEIYPATWQHAAEITKERISNPDLRKIQFRTADFAMYRIEGNDVELNLAMMEQNLILWNIDAVTDQFTRTNNYAPTKFGINIVIGSPSTLRVNLSCLDLEHYSNNVSFFKINCTEYTTTLNPSQKRLAERIYGSMQVRQGEVISDFDNAMKMLHEAEVWKGFTRFFVLSPNYVKSKLQNCPEDAIVTFCDLSSFECSSNFSADSLNIQSQSSYLRGVPLVKYATQGNEQIHPAQSYEQSYQMVIRNLDLLTEVKASRLLNLVNAYYTQRTR